VVTRLGTLTLKRQVLCDPDGGMHQVPGNQLLPAHAGCVLTRGLQEWACLLPQNLPFATVERLLGWKCGEAELLCDSSVRALVREHGQILRRAELAYAKAVLEQPLPLSGEALLVECEAPRRRAGWPAEMNEAVAQAVQAGKSRPPKGVSPSDWERVLTACEQEGSTDIEALRHLGPEPAPDQVVACVDEVLVRKPTCHQFWQLRTARIRTCQGTRYLSGTGEDFVAVLTACLLLCTPTGRRVLVLADGARWIRLWFAGVCARFRGCELIQDWYHLCKKSRELASLFSANRKDKEAVLKGLYARLWRGDVDGAVAVLEAYRPQSRNPERLEELARSLQERRNSIPDYHARRAHCEYIGSGLVENANNVLVAQRQKSHGRHWSLATSDGLAALTTLMLNGGWDRYWRDREVLPLAVG
jgi:hypothetical protein